MMPSRLTRLGPWLIIATLANSAYLWAVSSASLFYIANILVHLVLACVLMALWGSLGLGVMRESRPDTPALLSIVLFVLAAGTGVALIIVGNFRPNWLLLYVHIVACVGASGATLWWLRRLRLFQRRPALFPLAVAVLILAVAVPLSRPLWPRSAEDTITNTPLPAADMAGQAMRGADGPFFPAAAGTADGKLIPDSFFLDSKACGRSGCHEDVTRQWDASAHHFSSFNNQWYRKAIEYQQEVSGLQTPQWCAGCHDHALLFSGQMARPVASYLHTPAAQAGLGCVSCHNIKQVKSTIGNNDYVLEYPALHDLATSDNPVLRTLHDFILRLDPDPHRRTFLKPFHREQPAEFCSTCHKVHLDKPVNRYRWVRGFNTYDNWQASGVSGQGARSFYEPPAPRTCINCHMPLTPSNDAANLGGFVHSHRFVAANTALPTANRDSVQLHKTIVFLQNKQIRVDIFAVSEPEASTTSGDRRTGAAEGGGRLASTFAVGEEQGQAVGAGSLTGKATSVFAPLEDGMAVLNPGSSVRLDVVVRTLGLGHFFPSGTVDAQEAWLEVKAVDDTGRQLFWSGWTEDGGAGSVDPGAHFYRTLMVDGHANPINKRNAWATRAVVYVNLIPPGAANVAHYRLTVPDDVGDSVTITAKLHYRKFNWWNTHFAYAGVRDSSATPSYSPDYDDGPWVFTGDTQGVSGKVKSIPVLPIVTMAADSVTLAVTPSPRDTPPPPADPTLRRTRWNDYGIGLFLQGDLKGAEQAFRTVTRLDSTYADGWVNLARGYLQEGNLDAGEQALAAAERARPGFHKTLYFRGLWHKARGEYTEALRDLMAASAQFPRDRVVLNQIGRVHFLNDDLPAAIPFFKRVLTIDPEDLMAHYNLMLCYRALGDAAKADEHEARYRRFKADETSQAIARKYRETHPEDNNESLPIHEHPDDGAPPR